MARKGGKDRGLFERPKGSDIWWICYADSQGKKRREKAGMKRAAQALYTKRKRETREGVIKPTRKKKLLFKEIAEEALERSKARNASWYDDVNRSKDLLKEFGSREAESIRPRDITSWMDRFKVERDLAPATVNKYRALLSSIFSYAVQGERLNMNPVRNTKPLPVKNQRIRFLSTEEENRLLDVCYGTRRIEVLFALHTGVRQAAQFNLRWDEIRDGIAYFPHTKNGEDQYVHLNSLTQSLLVVLPQNSDYVFPESRTELLNNRKLLWWYEALEKAGIENFRWHDLRHTFASRLAMKGNNLRTIQEALSHKSPQMTMRYAHLSDTHMKDALEGLVNG